MPASYAPIDFNTPSGLSGQFLSTGSSFSSGSFGGDELALASELNAGTLHLAAIGAAGSIKFTTGGNTVGNQRMRILSNGNVGIGTATPNELLSVAGSGTFSGNLAFVGGARLAARTNSGLTLGDNQTGNIFFNQNGNVGIGLASNVTPIEKLDLIGNATVSGNLTLYGGARTIQTTNFGA